MSPARIDDRFLLIDTAGLKDPTDEFEAGIQDQITDAIDAATLILLTLDSSKYPDQRDRDIAKQALKSRKPVFLLLNKSDLGAALPAAEFLRLGIKSDHIFRVSATTGQGIAALKTAILHTIPTITAADAEDLLKSPSSAVPTLANPASLTPSAKNSRLSSALARNYPPTSTAYASNITVAPWKS